MSLEGASLRPDKGENRKLYGREMNNHDILMKPVAAPRGARPFVTALSRFAPKVGKKVA